MPVNRQTRERVSTLALSAGGAGCFVVIGAPLPMLLGPMAVCLIAAIAGARLRDWGVMALIMRMTLGVAAGASVTPALVARLPEMALTVAMVPVFVGLLGLLGYPFFRRVCGFDPATSFYAAMPGGLQDMLMFGEEAGADIRALALIHATRVLVIVSLAPFLIAAIWGLSLDSPPGAPATDIPWLEMVLMVAAAVVGWQAATRIGLFGAPILGPMIVTAALSLGGFLTNRPPAEAILIAQFFIGLSVGVRYVGITWRELRIDVGASIGFCVVLAVATVVFVQVIVLAGLAPPLDAFLAFAPGGQAEMLVLALVAGADLAFVVTHHVVRIVLILTLAPLIGRLSLRHVAGQPPRH